MLVTLDKKEARKLKKYLKSMYPKEGCGFLLGSETKKETLINYIFIPEDQEPHCFESYINVKESWWNEADELAKDFNLNVVGFIHSHPDFKDTSLSECDLAMTDYVHQKLKNIKSPIMGVVGIYKTQHRMMTKIGLWPLFNQHKLCLM